MPRLFHEMMRPTPFSLHCLRQIVYAALMLLITLRFEFFDYFLRQTLMLSFTPFAAPLC